MEYRVLVVAIRLHPGQAQYNKSHAPLHILNNSTRPTIVAEIAALFLRETRDATYATVTVTAIATA